MDYNERWEKIEKLGEGGQGEVYKVLDKSKFNLDEMLGVIRTGVRGTETAEKQREQFGAFRQTILDFSRMEDPVNQGALKVLHLPEVARDAALAEARLKDEMTVMSKISHPNLLEILDADSDFKWFVSQYHTNGSLDKNPLFKADFAGALKALRPLVEGVAKIHAGGYVHRDIKPHNVFVASDGRLILGDFGLIFYEDDQRTRISRTFENVGSRDWMPLWAQGALVEDIKPNFDVFSLGKLLWSMVAGPPKKLLAWYFNDPDYPNLNLENTSPDVPFIKLLNPLLAKSVVEREKNCLPDASSLLDEVDSLLSVIERDSQLQDLKPGHHKCRVCGAGKYEPLNQTGVELQLPSMISRWVCNNCGNIQLFASEWEVIGAAGNWEFDQDRIIGKNDGTILHRRKLPQDCALEFDVTLLENNGSDELDVVFSEVMLLFFRQGIRQDMMVSKEHHKQGTLKPIDGPVLGQTYSIKIEKKGTKGRYYLNGRQMISFSTSHGAEATRDRFGFGVHLNRVEFRNIKLDGKPIL